MKKDKKRFRTIRLITLLELVVILCFSLLTIFLTVNSSKYACKQELDYLTEKIEKENEELNDIIINCSEISYGILTSEDANLLKNYYYDKINDYYGRSLAIENLKKQLTILAALNTVVDGISLRILPQDDYFYPVMYSFNPSSSEKECFEYVMNSYVYSKDICDSLIFNNGELYYLYSPNKNDNSLICIKLKKSYLVDSFVISSLKAEYSDVKENENGSFYILCSNILVDDETINKYLNSDNEMFGFNFKEIYIKTTILDKITLLVISDNVFLVESRDNILITLIVLCILIILIGAVYLFVTLTYMNKPVKNLILAMEKVGQGKMNVKIIEKAKGDLQLINEGFNDMVDSLNSYVNENYIYQMKIVESEFKMLQSQINPHFLYNCFANISSLCKLNEMEKAQQFTSKLSTFFLYITRNNETLVRLKDEYNHMILYLDIQKIRFNERVEINTAVLDENIENVKIPKLILQPIVENAYKHVFSNMLNNGLLKISVTSFENKIRIDIENNGTIEDQFINELNNSLLDNTISKTGLQNVAKRLNFYSKGEGKMLLSKSEFGGLKVSLVLPKEIKK